ncbi:MAG TPA: shikimate kinase [Planctomycetota bacterium]|nr:shikimate kinase [Planctomycetota bacterium]
MNVILIGFRGCGKSTVGKALSDRLGREFIDCDAWIERHTGLTIREIFEQHGESHFRTLESQAIGELSAMDGKIIATGGGAALKYQNMQVFKRNGGRIFFLEVGPETAFQRIQDDATSRSRRPALTEKDPFTEVKEQIEFRRPYYLKGADVTVATDGVKLDEIVVEILKHIQESGPDDRGERRDHDPAPV